MTDCFTLKLANIIICAGYISASTVLILILFSKQVAHKFKPTDALNTVKIDTVEAEK